MVKWGSSDSQLPEALADAVVRLARAHRAVWHLSCRSDDVSRLALQMARRDYVQALADLISLADKLAEVDT